MHHAYIQYVAFMTPSLSESNEPRSIKVQEENKLKIRAKVIIALG
jgi:hypothetical protein